MALAYIRPSPARTIVVEVDYVEGRAPSASALDHVEAILERDLDKPVDVRADDVMRPRGSWSIAEIRTAEATHRDAFSAGDTATMWVAYLDGEMRREPDTLGVAYEASGAAVFRDRLSAASTAFLTAAAIERSVLTHEIGHLLGLVNIGYTSDYDHEDPAHPGHSNRRESVMYWQVEDVSIAAILAGGPPDDFDRYDRADLRARRSG